MAARSTAPVLSRRTLNRTLLGRQFLLERVQLPPEAIIERLVGLQAQEPGDPYVALWSRIEGFDPATLSTLIAERRAVRMGHLRGTLHLVGALDAQAHYPIFRDVMARAWRSSPFAKQLVGVDIDALVRAARQALEERPQTPSQLGAILGPSWPDRDPTALAYAARFLLPLVQVPPRGLWGQTSRATNTTLGAWLGEPTGSGSTVDELVLRYLAVFGPATVGDMRVWSWLTGLREVVERLRPRLKTYRDEAGRELFDAPDGAFTAADTPAPVRYLPYYDNVMLSHQDRSRILRDGMTIEALTWHGGVTVDGFVTGGWRIRRERRRATMTVTLGVRVTKTQRVETEAEGARLFEFLMADADEREVVIVEPD